MNHIRTLIYLVCFFFLFGSLAVAETNHRHEHPGQHAHHHGHANKHMNKRSFKELVERFESASRASWQKPNEVIKTLGSLEGKTVIDIGSGSGYFTFPLIEHGARVIAADVDQRFLDYIDRKRRASGISSDKLILRKVPHDSPALEAAEVDLALIVNTYHHIGNRVKYFEQVRKGLKPGGALYVVDFKAERTPVGPPVSMRLADAKVKDELRAAGFKTLSTNNSLLPYQYIVKATP